LRFDVRAAKDTPRFLENETSTTTTGGSNTLPRQPYITAQMRAILVSWLVEVGVEYDISDQAFHLAITLLDVMLAKGPADLHAHEEQCRRRRRRLRPAVAHYEDDEDDNSSANGSDNSSTEPECFVVQRSAFQAFGWYVMLFPATIMIC
jgi:Cyclin, N-terminal domain